MLICTMVILLPSLRVIYSDLLSTATKLVVLHFNN